MVQQFYVVRCCSCGSCQVHIERKDGKFCCKMCGLKQSVRKVYGKGSARDCRLHVQKLNNFIAIKNSADEAHLIRDALDTAASKLPSDEQRNNETEWLRGDQNSAPQTEVYVPLMSHSNSVVEEQFNGISGRQSVRYCLGDEINGITCDQVPHSTEVMEKPFQGFPDRSFNHQWVDEGRVYKNQESSLSYDQIFQRIERNDESFMDFEQFAQEFKKVYSCRGTKNQLGEVSTVQSLPGPSGIVKLEMDANELKTTKTTRETELFENEDVSDDDFCYHAASAKSIENAYKLKSSSGDPSSVMAPSRDHWKKQIPHELGKNSPVGRSRRFAADKGEVFANKNIYAPAGPSASSDAEVTVGKSRPFAADKGEGFAKKTKYAPAGPSASSHAEATVGKSRPFTNGGDEVFTKKAKCAPAGPSASSQVEVTVGRSRPFSADEDEVFAKKVTPSRGPFASSHVEVRQIGEGHTVMVKTGSDCTVHGSSSKSTLYSKYSGCDDLDDLTF